MTQCLSLTRVSPDAGHSCEHKKLPFDLSSCLILSLTPPPSSKMAEAVGLASAILGLTIFAYDTSKSLYEAVSNFRTQRKTIKDLQNELNSLTTILGSIRAHVEQSDKVQRLEPLQEPLECCLTICQEMRETLEACTKHSAEGRDSIRDWLNMRYHGKSFEDMTKRLNSYKSTLSITFASINM